MEKFKIEKVANWGPGEIQEASLLFRNLNPEFLTWLDGMFPVAVVRRFGSRWI